MNARIREERRLLSGDTRQLSWIDWLQQQASNGRSDALEALRVSAWTRSCPTPSLRLEPPRLLLLTPRPKSQSKEPSSKRSENMRFEILVKV